MSLTKFTGKGIPSQVRPKIKGLDWAAGRETLKEIPVPKRGWKGTFLKDRG